MTRSYQPPPAAAAPQITARLRMSLSTTGRRQRLPCRAGLTLIELMVVAVVVSILAAMAYPSLKHYVRRTHRASAIACLQELSLLMERRYSTGLAYDSSSSLPTASCVAAVADRYDLSFASGQPTAGSFTLQATPRASQSDPECGTLSLDHQGTAAISGSGNVQSCWR